VVLRREWPVCAAARAQAGEIDPYQATRLASILTGLRSALEAVEFERRLDALEALAAGDRPGLKVVK
jgi:hypothetical protein